MAKDLGLAKLLKEEVERPEKPATEISPVVKAKPEVPKKAEVKPEAVKKPKAADNPKKQGRKCKDETRGAKKNYCRTINILVPEELFDALTLAADVKCKGNKTDYINMLIQKDAEENGTKYKSAYDMINRL